MCAFIVSWRTSQKNVRAKPAHGNDGNDDEVICVSASDVGRCSSDDSEASVETPREAARAANSDSGGGGLAKLVAAMVLIRR